MTTLRTNLGNTRESGRQIRIEPFGSLDATNVQEALEEIAADAAGSITRTAVVFAQSPYTALQTDTWLDVDTSGGAVTINLATAASRTGVPLVVKDATGNAAANNITVTPNGAETIDGLASVAVNIDYGGYRFVPATAKYEISP